MVTQSLISPFILLSVRYGLRYPGSQCTVDASRSARSPVKAGPWLLGRPGDRVGLGFGAQIAVDSSQELQTGVILRIL